MKILALSTKVNQILYTYSVDPKKARNAKTKLSLVQGPKISYSFKNKITIFKLKNHI